MKFFSIVVICKLARECSDPLKCWPITNHFHFLVFRPLNSPTNLLIQKDSLFRIICVPLLKIVQIVEIVQSVQSIHSVQSVQSAKMSKMSKVYKVSKKCSKCPKCPRFPRCPKCLKCPKCQRFPWLEP